MDRPGKMNAHMTKSMDWYIDLCKITQVNYKEFLNEICNRNWKFLIEVWKIEMQICDKFTIKNSSRNKSNICYM